MAITKIHPIRRTLSKAIEYIIDPVKASNDMLITTFGCTKESAAEEFLITKRSGSERCFTLAQHVIQSFKPDEIDAKTAHEVAVKLANQFTGSQHEYVIATHVDKDHIHNHIIFNHTNFVTHKAFRGNIKASKILQQISDELCLEYGLRIIEHPKKKGMTKYEWMMKKKGLSYKKLLQDNIDISINSSNSFDEFLDNMQKLGYEIKQGKYIAFRKKEQERFVRSKSLGPEYEEDSIKERIISHPTTQIKSAFTYNDSLGLIRNMNNFLIAMENPLYRQKVSLSNIKKISTTYNFLISQQIDSLDTLNEHITSTKATIHSLRESVRNIEDQIHNCSELLIHVKRVTEHKKVYKEYTSPKCSEDFLNKHYSNIILYEAAIQYINKHTRNGIPPTSSKIRKELEQLESQKCESTKELMHLKENLKKYETARKNISMIMDNKKENRIERRVR